jgi:hypothetical protein
MSSLVKYFINKYECKPEFEHHISSITKINEKWYFIANKCNVKNYLKVSFSYFVGVFQLFKENKTFLMQLY